MVCRTRTSAARPANPAPAWLPRGGVETRRWRPRTCSRLPRESATGPGERQLSGRAGTPASTAARPDRSHSLAASGYTSWDAISESLLRARADARYRLETVPEEAKLVPDSLAGPRRCAFCRPWRESCGTLSRQAATRPGTPSPSLYSGPAQTHVRRLHVASWRASLYPARPL
jgi:hypothetical protein